MILQLDPTVPLDTPKGPGFAHFLWDYGQEHDVLFGCFIDETGEFWIYSQRQVRLQKNITMGIRCSDASKIPETKGVS